MQETMAAMRATLHPAHGERPGDGMAKRYIHEQLVLKVLARSLAGLVVLALLAYPLDWAVWRLRVAAGGGMGKVAVDHFVVAELKANKEEYYSDGTVTVDCSRSLFPEAGSGACWWVARHREVFDRY